MCLSAFNFELKKLMHVHPAVVHAAVLSPAHCTTYENCVCFCGTKYAWVMNTFGYR